MSSLALSYSFEYLCYWSTAVRNIFTLTVHWVDFSRQNLTTKVDPRAVRVTVQIFQIVGKIIFIPMTVKDHCVISLYLKFCEL